jgi:hypothetical protein
MPVHVDRAKITSTIGCPRTHFCGSNVVRGGNVISTEGPGLRGRGRRRAERSRRPAQQRDVSARALRPSAEMPTRPRTRLRRVSFCPARPRAGRGSGRTRTPWA